MTFAYDLVGNLTSAQDADSQLSFQYDARNRLKQVDTAATIAQPASSITNFYDKNGNPTNVNLFVGSSGNSRTFTYDALNRLIFATSGAFGGPINFTYDALSRRTSMTLSNGVVANYGGNRGQLSSDPDFFCDFFWPDRCKGTDDYLHL